MTINTKQSTLFTLLVAIACCLVTFEASAANFTVNNTNDSGTNSLREAIDLANGNAEDDVITITATGTITLASNLPVITTNMTIIGSGSASLTIDGVDTYKIFEITGSSTVVTLEGMTITKGEGKVTSIIDLPASKKHGGGIFLYAATLTVNSCTISNHTQCEFGGGFFNLNGSATFNTCTFSSNVAQETTPTDATGLAGAVYVHADAGQTAFTEMNDCTINNNSSEDIAGALVVAAVDPNPNDAILNLNNCQITNNSADRDGGVLQAYGGTVNFNDCTVQGNSSNSGGGALVPNSYNTGSVVNCTNTNFISNSAFSGGAIAVMTTTELNLQNCTFSNNIATNTDGGAIKTNATLNIDQTTFSGNQTTGSTAGSYGAGISVVAGAVTITNSTFSNNISNLDGGAMEIGGGTVDLTNVTFSGNTAKTYGGAIDAWAGTVTLTNCTVVGNQSDSDNSITPDPGNYGVGGPGGGLSESGSTMTITNCIVANNTLGDGSTDDLYSDNTIASGGHNVVEDNSGLATDASDETGQDPNLGTLMDNNGAVQTHAPNVGSIAIGLVDNGSAPCTDARLAARIGNADAGAYESGGTFSDVSVSVSPSSVAENSGSNLVYTFTRTGQTCEDLLVNFSVAGTAVLGTDYNASNATTFNSSTGSVVIPDGSSSVSLNVTPINNSATDGSRTIILTITTGSGYNIDGSNSNSTGTITDDESPTIPTITISATTSSVSESISENLVFQFTRTGDTSSALSINFSIAGTAVNSDFTLSGEDSYDAGTNTGTITIPIGASTADLTVTPTDDSLIEANETVIVKVENP